ncbi:HIT family protein [Embleya sp. NPDC050493]|uniref:HIT family protein n=1 Tax=Embleya sp. NPDC050493 TaxID=3363989 RepID=UPI0037A7CCA1
MSPFELEAVVCGSQVPGPRSLAASTWPERYAEPDTGAACSMCDKDFTAPDIGWGLLIKRGVYGNAYLWRAGRVRGYVVVVWTGGHVARLTALSARQLAGFMAEVTRVGRAIEAHYRPAPKLNVSLLENDIPHLHAHLIPRHPDEPNPERTPVFAHLEHDQQDEARIRSDAAGLRALLARMGGTRAAVAGDGRCDDDAGGGGPAGSGDGGPV